jgi:acyl carrier protein
MIGNPARISGESGDRPVYGVSAAAEHMEEKPERATAEDAQAWTPARIAETYWEVFSACFEGYDYNPVTFRFHEDGWDSASQMALVAGLEAAFGISFKGREVLKMNSFESGLNLVRKKLDDKSKGEG